MRFWDTSALLPLVVQEPGTTAVSKVFHEDSEIIVWWAARIEMASGITRLRRQGKMTESEVSESLGYAIDLTGNSEEVEPSENVRITAMRLLRIHDLRAADAMHLAAALVWTGHMPDGIGFVCLDARLRSAAGREGFTVLPAEI